MIAPRTTPPSLFQHTAARRRLRPAARAAQPGLGFNTQPPEGGCYQAENNED